MVEVGAGDGTSVVENEDGVDAAERPPKLVKVVDGDRASAIGVAEQAKEFVG